MNRGGALFVDHMQYEHCPQLARGPPPDRSQRDGQPICGAPFGYLFVGYDGQYYLCCSDWKKEVPLGSVFDAVVRRRHRPTSSSYVTSREPVCKTCNLDPLNRLTEELRAIDARSGRARRSDRGRQHLREPVGRRTDARGGLADTAAGHPGAGALTRGPAQKAMATCSSG